MFICIKPEPFFNPSKRNMFDRKLGNIGNTGFSTLCLGIFEFVTYSLSLLQSAKEYFV